MTCSESDESLQRRARVAFYRTQCGELVRIPADDPMLSFFLEMGQSSRPHGNPIGAIPEAL